MCRAYSSGLVSRKARISAIFADISILSRFISASVMRERPGCSKSSEYFPACSDSRNSLLRKAQTVTALASSLMVHFRSPAMIYMASYQSAPQLQWLTEPATACRRWQMPASSALFPHRYRGEMTFPRRPRFERAHIQPMQLTERDREIIRHVERHRFVRSTHITDLVGGSHQQVIRRLQLLYHHGYVDRPRAQIDYYHQGGSKVLAYGLGNGGAALLSRERGIAMDRIDWSEKNRSVRGIYLAHTLGVADVMVALEVACRTTGRARLLYDDELRSSGTGDLSFPWRVDIEGRKNLGVIPDRVFALEYQDENNRANRAYFFLEADRGTMPVTREGLSQSSFYRKLLAYEATWSQGIHSTRFGFHRFRVLTVTTSQARVKSMVDACGQLKSGHGLFLFADRTILDRPEGILAAPWLTGRLGEISFILG